MTVNVDMLGAEAIVKRLFPLFDISSTHYTAHPERSMIPRDAHVLMTEVQPMDYVWWRRVRCPHYASGSFKSFVRRTV
jgi:hypothetical protein